MALSNAENQRAYRQRHIKDMGGTAARLDIVVDADAVTALKRMAAHYRVSKREMLQTILANAQRQTLDGIANDLRDAYYDAVQA